MSNPGQPVGQMAYQQIAMQKFSAAMKCFQQTANRYGGGGLAFTVAAGSFDACDSYVFRRRKGVQIVPLGGQAAITANISSSGGTGYVANDVVTFSPINGGRSIVIKVTHVTAGNPDAITVLDQGGGLVGGGNGFNGNSGSAVPGNDVLTQLSTTGVGVPGVWTLNGNGGIPFGWVFPQPNPSA